MVTDTLYAVVDLTDKTIMSVNAGFGAARMESTIPIETNPSLALTRLNDLKKQTGHDLKIAKVRIQVLEVLNG